MDGLHKNIFGITERGGIPNVLERSLQKLLDALLTAAAEPEAVKINKRLQTIISCSIMPLLSAAAMRPNNFAPTGR